MGVRDPHTRTHSSKLILGVPADKMQLASFKFLSRKPASQEIRDRALKRVWIFQNALLTTMKEGDIDVSRQFVFEKDSRQLQPAETMQHLLENKTFGLLGHHFLPEFLSVYGAWGHTSSLYFVDLLSRPLRQQLVTVPLSTQGAR